MEPSKGDFLSTEIVEEGRIAVIRFAWADNPFNNLCDALADEMEALLDEAGAAAEIRAVVLTAEGPVFSTGAWLPELLQQDAAGALRLARKGVRIWSMFETIPKPTCAAVNGLCLGGGLELALCCDFRVASKRARFGQTEVSLGLIPGWGGCQRLTRLLGRGKALDLVLTGRQFRVDEALEMGLVHKAVPHADLLPEAIALLRPIIANEPETVALAKEAMLGCLETGHAECLDRDAVLFSQAWDLPEAKAKVRAFLDKGSKGA